MEWRKKGILSPFEFAIFLWTLSEEICRFIIRTVWLQLQRKCPYIKKKSKHLSPRSPEQGASDSQLLAANENNHNFTDLHGFNVAPFS